MSMWGTQCACLRRRLQVPSMWSMLCLRWGGVGDCQGVVPGAVCLELPVTQAAQPHVRALKPCHANLFAGCFSCRSSCLPVPAGVFQCR